MFNEVGTKIVMLSADSFCKEKADAVTLSNGKNGVAYYLEKLIKYSREGGM
ncbi:MAG: HAD hydrolase family protein [bacterium]|nr:HAD hydrolase family protein [bacterium]